jgi:hypothetical protein
VIQAQRVGRVLVVRDRLQQRLALEQLGAKLEHRELGRANGVAGRSRPVSRR